ncbi:MAG TPA: HAD family phosphatase [Chitinophagaceae bacterium]|nr:HAD family phosphatase [Chitinophagaceae bacterium]
MKINTIIFDLGGVLIDWNPRYVYRTIFKTEEEIDWFFENVATHDWNENQDAGYPIAKATEELVAQHPEWEKEIKAYYGRWTEMLGGPIDGTVEIFRQLKDNPALKTYALTNWSAETFHIALERYDFLHWFDGRVVSGDEKTRKPFHDFYQRLLDRYNVSPGQALFIDDNLRNVKAAEDLGIKGVHFHDPGQLKMELEKLGLFVRK